MENDGGFTYIGWPWLSRHGFAELEHDVSELISMLPWMVALVAAAAAVNTKH